MSIHKRKPRTKQSLTFVLKITCRKTELLFDYGSAVWDSPLTKLDMKDYKTLNYYAALKDEFDELTDLKQDTKDLIDEEEWIKEQCDDEALCCVTKPCNKTGTLLELYNNEQRIRSLLHKLNSYNDQVSNLAPSFNTHDSTVTTTMSMTRSSSDTLTKSEIEDLIDNAETMISEVEKRLSADPIKKLDQSNSVFYKLPQNYRPPSKYGFAIPSNKKIYNANLNKNLWSYLAGSITHFINYKVSQWDELRTELIEKTKSLGFDQDPTSKKWPNFCDKDYSVADDTGGVVNEKRNFKMYNVDYEDAECLKRVPKIKANQYGYQCIKVQAVFSGSMGL